MSNVIDLFSRKKIMKHAYGSGTTEPFTYVNIKLHGVSNQADALRRAAIVLKGHFEPEKTRPFISVEMRYWLIGYVCGIAVAGLS